MKHGDWRRGVMFRLNLGSSVVLFAGRLGCNVMLLNLSSSHCLIKRTDTFYFL